MSPKEAYDAFCAGNLTLCQAIKEVERYKQQGDWFPANNGTEQPFITRTGRKLLYVWQPRTGKHAYLDCGTDLILTDEEAQLALGV